MSGDLDARTLSRLSVDPASAGVEARDGPADAVALDAPLGVAAVQTALNDLGFEAGVADGLLGPRTREAIRAFQAANDLPVTGQPSPELTRALRAATRS